MTNDTGKNDKGAAMQLSQLPSQAPKLSSVKSSISVNSSGASAPISTPKVVIVSSSVAALRRSAT